jgi:hypothetical protein
LRVRCNLGGACSLAADLLEVRLLARAERRSKQALKLVEKWKSRLADLDREIIYLSFHPSG